MSSLFVSSSSSSSPSARRTTRLLSFVKQNNQGLIFLRNGDIIEARKCFAEALRGAQIGLVVSGSSNGGATAVTGGVSNHQEQQSQQQEQQAMKNSNGDAVAVPNKIAAPDAVTPTITASIAEAGDAGNNNDTSSTIQFHGNRTTDSTSSPKRKNFTTSTTTRATTRASDSDTDIVFDFRQEFFSRLQALPTASRLQDQAIGIFMEPSQLSCANMALIYAVIIYNIGLVYHVRGKQCQSDVLLRKAFDLYDNARSIVLVELSSSPSTPDDDDYEQEPDQQQQQDEYPNELPLSSSSSSRRTRRRRLSSSSSIDIPNTSHHHDHHYCCRNPIVDLLRLSLLKQMADVQKSLSNIPLARILCDEITAFITSVVDQGGEFMYRDSRVTGLMNLQVGSFFIYAISLQQALVIAPAA